ncbi:microfibril-associated glycoprotein 4-like [Littorina saxatilis]
MRQNSSVDFYRGWTDYVNGFGDLAEAYWLGLEAIHQMTSNTPHDLRVELEDWNDIKATAEYSGFSLSSASDNYTLFFQSFVGGDAGDSLTYHNRSEFTTKDRHNDLYIANCANKYLGAWWYVSCHRSNLCGVFTSHNTTAHGQGIQWSTWKGQNYSLKFAQMMVRPSQ